MRGPVVTLLLLSACASSAPAERPPPPAAPAESKPRAQPEPAEGCASALPCLRDGEALVDVSAARGIEALGDCLDCPDVSSAAYRLLADVLRGEGEHEEARRILLEGRKRFPRSVDLLVALGRAERRLGRTEAAIAAFGEAHRLRPSDELVESEYQRMLAQHGSPEQRAEAAVRPLIREASGRFQLEDHEGALEALALALERAGDHARVRADVLHRMAVVELGRAEAERTLALTARALKGGALRSDQLADLALLRSEAFLLQERFREARSASLRCIELRPRDPRAQTNLAFASLRLRRREEALSALRSAVDGGLPRLLTYRQFTALGEPVERMLQDPEFAAIIRKAWPGRSP